MPEKIKSNIGLAIVIIGFLVTIFTGGIGYGQLLSKNDTLDQNVKAHCVNQDRKDEIRAINDREMMMSIATLTESVKQLNKSVDMLSSKVDRMK